MSKSKSEITRRLLIQSALDVLSRTSYKGAKLQDVAVEVGLSRGAIYWHFKNKQDLYEQVFYEYFDISMNEIYKIIDNGESVIATISRIVDYLVVDHVDANHKSALIYNGMVLEAPEDTKILIKRVDKLFQRLFEMHNEMLQRGVEKGELRSDIDSRLETRALYSFIWGYYTNKVRFFSRRNPSDIRSYILQKFVYQLL
ncbi:TetR/AcrR family transcriptional regulator [Halosquirtibacter laminarini]|uniref:TetR/AcrR family transcriptional regulator n=1 Tax=Halosquirtibacter laminarini TaxID=3374600 RepID=A0AC61NJ71_9BACT|nr:TetR/AcrR family transcriptional regulator [Prolixibacteraceae bacterium]